MTTETENTLIVEPVTTRLNGGWVKGVSGNPRGRPPKGKTFADIARNLPDKRKEAMVEAMVDQALAGKVNAFEAVRDTAEGKPRQTVVTIDDSVGDDLLEQLRLKLAAKHGVIDADYTVLPPAD